MPALPSCTAFGPSPSGSSGGRFVLDPAERRLLRDGQPVVLTPRAFDLLVLLASQPGHLVTKDELMAGAWPGVVVEGNALSVAVSRLRAALGETGHGLIETVPGRGYRFAAPVSALSPAPGGSEGEALLAGPRVEDVFPVLAHSGDGAALPGPRLAAWARAPAARPARRLWWRGALGVGVVAVALGAGLALWSGRPERPPAPAPAASVPSPPAPHEVPAEALVAYRRGHALWASRRGAEMAEALGQFKRATVLDPLFARAYVGEARVYAFAYRAGPAADAAIARALALDSTLAEAWATRAFVRAFQAWDWAGADADFARARALGPDDVTTLQWTASLRMVQRRLPEADSLLQRALALDPDDAALHADLCELRYYRRAYPGARAACDHARALDPRQPMARNHRFSLTLAAPGGRAEAAHRLAGFRRADFDNAFRARLHARLGARDSALAYVERAVAERAFVAPFLNADPLFDFVRADARWRAAMRQVGLQ